MTQITIALPDREALALAQFAKRSTWATYRECATNADETRAMIQAIEALRDALAAAGFAPR